MVGQRRIQVDVLGGRPVARMIQAPARASRDFGRSWEVIADEFEQMTARQFSSHGSEMGTPWADLADGSPATLHDRGDLEESFTRSGEGHVREIHGDRMEWGSDLRVESGGWVLGRLHQDGTDRMPPRVIFNLDEPRRRRVVEVLMEGLFRDTGGRVRAPSGRFAAVGF